MSAVEKQTLISEQDYLSGELRSRVRHEYLGGYVHAMAGNSNRHTVIETNLTITFGTKLKGRPCRPYSTNTKIRIPLPNQLRYYYPDLSIVCEQNSQDDSFQDAPVVIVEILSRSTRRIDTGEKLRDYLTLPSLMVYILVEQDEPFVVVHRRRGEVFDREVYERLDAVIPLPEIGVELPLTEIYDDVEFSPEPDPDELDPVDG